GVRGPPAHLGVLRTDLHARRARLHRDAGDLVGPGGGRGDDQIGHRPARVGDEALRAVDHPLPALQSGAGVGATGVGPAARLGERERAQALPGRQARQPAPPLLLGAELRDRLGAERHRRLDGDRHRGVDARDLLQREAQHEQPRLGSAVLLGQRDAEDAELAQLADQIGGEDAPLVVIADHGPYLRLGELPHRGGELRLLRGQSHGSSYTGVIGCLRSPNRRSLWDSRRYRAIRSARRSAGSTMSSTTISPARRRRSTSASYSWRRSATKRSRSASSSMAAILPAYTAFTAASAPMTAIFALGRASTASEPNAGPAIAYSPAP